MKNITKLSIFFIGLIILSCEKPNKGQDIPQCIQNKIELDKKACLDVVYEFQYKSNTVYFFSYPCPEGCYQLLDENCNTVTDSEGNPICYCVWIGAFCSDDFFNNRTDERMIWQRASE